MESITNEEKEILIDVYGIAEPEKALAGADSEEKEGVLNILEALREPDPGSVAAFSLDHAQHFEELQKEAQEAAFLAESKGIKALSHKEKRAYIRYLLGHTNKFNAKGEAVKPIHANIADLILCEKRIIVLNQVIHIYHEETGTYVPDPKGNAIKTSIRSYLDRDFIEAKTIDAIYSLILSDSRFIVSDGEVNHRPKHWIHFRNGYYDYQTDEIHPHDPAYHETHVIPWEYEPKKYPGQYRIATRGEGLCMETVHEPLLFDRVLEAMIPDLESRKMFLQYVGYAMSLDTSAQKFLLICGCGGTGKSTLLKLVEEIIGSENVVNISLQGLQDRFAPASLYMKQANICADIPLTALEEVDMIKKLTGEDMISAERKNKDHFFFRSYARLFFSANDIPYIAEKTNAFYRRMLILKMDQIPDRIDPDLFEKLREEIPNIITQIMEELYCSEGEIEESTISKEAVKAAHKNSDTVEAFLDDRCKVGERCRIDSSDLYKAYFNYCCSEERTALTNRKFYRELEKRGFQRRRGDRNYNILGVELSNVIRMPESLSSAASV